MFGICYAVYSVYGVQLLYGKLKQTFREKWNHDSYNEI